jgi:transposase
MQTFLVGAYNKIPNSVRDRLVEMVVVEGHSIKEASIALNLKYSTAKTIYKIFKKEN